MQDKSTKDPLIAIREGAEAERRAVAADLEKLNLAKEKSNLKIMEMRRGSYSWTKKDPHKK